jgi:hypothetical protein
MIAFLSHTHPPTHAHDKPHTNTLHARRVVLLTSATPNVRFTILSNSEETAIKPELVAPWNRHELREITEAAMVAFAWDSEWLAPAFTDTCTQTRE